MNGNNEDAITLYDKAAKKFGEAEKAASDDTVEKYCYEARKLANHKARTIEENGNDDYESSLQTASRGREVAQYEVRSPSDIKWES
ncbi:hypothetical protein [Natrinema halophilum]|uniref:hypothetical protein n=1 Tax=Natrinema halophilum TaxID=1699371 RepID=UPI001F3A79DA|nr:hypothetical protein [Natrinema halophilum]UHQ96019.1 hypothetical protein HYG82_21315 [Natrinema halophilum]